MSTVSSSDQLGIVHKLLFKSYYGPNLAYKGVASVPTRILAVSHKEANCALCHILGLDNPCNP